MAQVLSLTEDAKVRIKEILSESEKDKIGVRIAVSEGGCAGYSYEMTYVDNADPKDELIEPVSYTHLTLPTILLV